MQYLYSFANLSLILRVMDRISQMTHLPVASITIIYLVDRWVMRLTLKQPITTADRKNLIAFLRENGISHNSSVQLLNAFIALDQGQTPTQVMNTYQTVVVSHGGANPTELHEFCDRFVEGLGYYPPSLV